MYDISLEFIYIMYLSKIYSDAYLGKIYFSKIFVLM